jgi:lipopolysaccharide/colanic/teichoic acid biosynthesis glycosyltransferase
VDLVFAMLGLILFLPLLLLIAILIKIDSSGPVLYDPVMMGQYGRLFRLCRFRTMYKASAALPAEQRHTRVGRFIRNYSLDHLPMLLNLLRGDLTLIGPRPMELRSVDIQDPLWKRYFEAKPGLFNYAVLRLG